ncbi:MAG: hypothetical protein E7551_00975 [Ruminococcaceae bacterium]|nr:hypothetical protein [Oscillospiraceae bacterium]
MKNTSSKITKNKTSVLELINQNNSLIFMVFCLILGFLAGVLIFKTKSIAEGYYSKEFINLYNELNSGFVLAILNSFLEQLPFVAAIFLSGTCMVGTVLVPSALVVRGAVYGMIFAYAYFTYGLMGIVFSLLILIPSAVISSIGFILSSREAVGFSLSLARLAFPETKKPHIEQDFKLYCMRQLFVMIFFVTSAFVQGLMSVSFISFFKF